MLTKRPEKGRIIVFGMAFWCPLGGMIWQVIHYLIGLRRLGYDVYYVEDSARYVYSVEAGQFTADAEANIAAVVPVLDSFDFAGRWAFRGAYEGGRCYGMTEERLAELYREADAFLNVTGGQELRDEHMRVPRRIYVETDPVVSQIQVAAGHTFTIDQLSRHDTHFTFGENIGAPDCLLPVERFRWLPTRQPVVIDLWHGVTPPPASPYSTIGAWKQTGRDIVFRGETYYWSKDREFMKFLDLPQRCRQAPPPLRDVRFELATGVDDPTARMLRDHGWLLTDPLAISRDINAYRQYIQRSRGEFTVAKDQNIRLRSGWFSDRSACYLAAGRPVITQETGFSNILPTGRALFGFMTMDDIICALETIERDYPAACREARSLAAECFAAEKVLASLMSRAGL